MIKANHKWWILGLVIVGMVTVAAVPWTYWDAGIRAQLARQIRHATGLETQITEPVTIALLPRPHIKIRSVRIKDSWDNLDIDIQILKGDLRLLALLSGRLEVSTLSLILPTITMNIHGRPLHNRGAIAKASATPRSSPQAKVADATRLGTVKIIGGRVLMKSSSQSAVTQIGDVNASLDWHSISSPARFEGTLIWRGEKVEIKTLISKPGELLRAQQSPITLQLASRLLTADLTGMLASGKGWQYQGKISASSPAFRALVSVTGAQWPAIGSITSVSLNSQINIRPGSASLSGLTLQLDDNIFAGTLAIHNQSERPLISGTLATNKLSIDHRSANLPHLTIAGDKWNSNPLPVQVLSLTDLDLRMSAKTAYFNKVAASDLAIVAILRNRKLELTISSPNAYNGSFRAKFGIEQGPALPALRGALNFEAIDMAAFLRSISRRLRISGTAKGNVAFTSAGGSFADIASLASGKLEINLAKGSIAGLDLEEAMRLAKTLPLSLPDRIRQGSTPVNHAAATAVLKDGQLTLTKASIDSGTVSSIVSGGIDVPNRELNLTITATQPTAEQSSKTGPLRLEMNIVGPWSKPSIVPNLESLIMRSKAAEPLLRTIRNLRDAAAARAPAPTPAAGQAP